MRISLWKIRKHGDYWTIWLNTGELTRDGAINWELSDAYKSWRSAMFVVTGDRRYARPEANRALVEEFSEDVRRANRRMWRKLQRDGFSWKKEAAA
jgi:hypothetical protein